MAEARPDGVSVVGDGGDGDSRAFEAFYRQWEGAVYRTALALLRDQMTAEEVVVDTFLRAHGAWHRLDPGRSPLPWLQRVTVNLALNRLRRRRLGLEPIPEQEPWPDEAGIAPESAAEQRELTAALARGIERLPVQMRAVVILRFVQDSSLASIAEVLDCPLGTVKSRLHNALRLLRDDLRQEFEPSLGADVAPRLSGGSEEPAS
ncbi:MAG: RNA polymerase sigma factor [Candidatus Limnocylindrales bacterium]